MRDICLLGALVLINEEPFLVVRHDARCKIKRFPCSDCKGDVRLFGDDVGCCAKWFLMEDNYGYGYGYDDDMGVLHLADHQKV